MNTTRRSATISSVENPAVSADEFPPSMSLNLEKAADLRYGENPHQIGGALSQQRRQVAVAG